jgi:hypothetical protein
LARLAVLAGIAMSIAIGACSLNPQPIPPGFNGPENAIDVPGTKQGADGSTMGASSDASAIRQDDAADGTDAPAVPSTDGGAGPDVITNPPEDGGSDGWADADADASDGAPE